MDPAFDIEPAWSPTGDQIVWRRASGVYIQASDGSGVPRRLIGTGGENPTLSPDGQYLLFHQRSPQNDRDIWYLRLEDDKPIPFLQSSFHEGLPVPSPDGRYLAYISDESGRFEVYIRQFPNGENKVQISVNGGTYPRWNGQGDELFYVEGDILVAVSIKTSPSIQVGKPQRLFTGSNVNARLLMGAAVVTTYDVSADGQRFVVIQQEDTGSEPGTIGIVSPGITIVQNWYAEFQNQK
jgi:Tol biopolymer transport system component